MAGWRFRARKPHSLQTHLRGEGFFTDGSVSAAHQLLWSLAVTVEYQVTSALFSDQAELLGNKRP